MARMEPVMTVKEFSEIWGCTDEQARRIFRGAKTLNAYKMGNKFVCDYDDFLKWNERKKITHDVMCMQTTANVVDAEDPEIKLLLLNGISPDKIVEVFNGDYQRK